MKRNACQSRMSTSVPQFSPLYSRCTMNSTSWWLWTTFVALRSPRVPWGLFCVTETVQGSSLLSGASKTGSLSAPRQVCSVKCCPFRASNCISYQWCPNKEWHWLDHSCFLSLSLPGIICFYFCPFLLSFIMYRIPGSRLWLGRLPETVRGRGSSSALLPNCKSTSFFFFFFFYLRQASV